MQCETHKCTIFSEATQDQFLVNVTNLLNEKMPKPKMTKTYHFILANSRNIQFSISLPTENWHESFTHFQMLFGYSAVKNSKLTSSLNV